MASKTDPKGELTHLDAQGAARMVDVSGKQPTRRRALARALVRMDAHTCGLLRRGALAKGEALAVARVAGITGAKETHRLLPLCHPLPLSQVSVAFREQGEDTIEILAEARAEASTGVEMEALTGAAVAALALYDMVKGVCRGASIACLELLEKEGGRSGMWRREAGTAP